MTDHHPECWRNPTHIACAWARIAQLEAQVRKLTAETRSAGCCTHTAFTPMTHHGPTWGAPCDDPPSYTP